jgi:hypothetical protein
LARVFAFLLIFFAALSARADDVSNYTPGTVGYLYDNFRLALESATKYSQLQETYCGAFSEGYFWGAMATSNVSGEVDKDDPCAEEKQKEYDRINNRFCGNFPKIDAKTTTTGDALRAATSIVARWIEFEKEHAKGDPLKRGVLREINGLVRPGEFCSELKGAELKDAPFPVNPELMKMNLTDFMTAKASMTYSAKYERCRKDVLFAAGDSKKFLGTKCGAEISGYISGLHSTDHLQENRTEPSKQCKKPIDRLYNSMDVTKTMCVPYDTNPLRVAEIFIQKYPELGLSELDVGSIGYVTIFRGFLCADQAAGN